MVAPSITLLARHVKALRIVDQQIICATHNEAIYYPFFIPEDGLGLRIVLDSMEGSVAPSRSMASDSEALSK
jgi:hypothetical protein